MNWTWFYFIFLFSASAYNYCNDQKCQNSFVSKNDLIWQFLSGGNTTIPAITKQKLLSFWQLYNTSLNAAEQCQFIFCHNPNTTTSKVHNLVLVLQISRCFLGQQNLQDLGLVLNLWKMAYFVCLCLTSFAGRPAAWPARRHDRSGLPARRQGARGAL